MSRMFPMRIIRRCERVDGNEYSKNLSAVSIESLTPDKDATVIWRGPVKHSVIRQYISDVDWGDLEWKYSVWWKHERVRLLSLQ